MKARRVLIAGDFWFGASGAGIAHGLRAQGHVVSEVSLSYNFVTGSGLVDRVVGRLMTPFSISSYQCQLLEAVVQQRPEVLIAMKGSYLTPAFLDRVRMHGVLLVNYYPDVAFSHDDFSERWFDSYDLVATTKHYHLPWLAKRFAPDRFALVQHGYSTLVHRRIGDGSKADAFDWDICHVGIASPAKVRWLKGIAQRHPGRSIMIAGNGWNADGYHLEGCQFAGPLLGDAYARAIERSRVNIAVHYGPAGGQGWEDAISTRTFEIPACGGFMLHIDSDEVRDLYKVGQEIDVFATPEDLHARIDEYLDNPERRMAIAAAGHDRAVPAYSYDARAAEMMALIEQRL